jgi:hypothetical protein
MCVVTVVHIGREAEKFGVRGIFKENSCLATVVGIGRPAPIFLPSRLSGYFHEGFLEFFLGHVPCPWNFEYLQKAGQRMVMGQFLVYYSPSGARR